MRKNRRRIQQGKKLANSNNGYSGGLGLNDKQKMAMRRAQEALEGTIIKTGFPRGEEVYGAITFRGMVFALKNANVIKTDFLLDIGSGIGQFPAVASVANKCRAAGVELNHDRHEAALKYVKSISKEAQSRIKYINQDVLTDNSATQSLKSEVTVAYICNLKFSPATNEKIWIYLNDFSKLRAIICLEKFRSVSKTRGGLNADGQKFAIQEIIFPRGSFNWSDSPLKGFIYHLKQ